MKPFLAGALMALMAGLTPAADDYKLGPDSQKQPGVPEGKLAAFTWDKSTIYKGTTRKYWIYTPANTTPDTPVCLMVFQDGAGFISPTGQYRAPIVLDNLIHKKAIPPIAALFVDPGVYPDKPGNGGRNRSVEYDTLSDQYVSFLEKELLPEVAKVAKIREGALNRAICGNSSGGICAFTAAWERPDLFGKVLSHIGSFTNIRGGDVYPGKIRKGPKKDVRVLLQDGFGDLDNEHGSWPLANLQMAAALRFRDYDYKLVMGDGAHNGKHGGAIFPESLTWLWAGVK
jgi:enterochelin esterase family protein